MISGEEIQNLAELSRLKLSDEEITGMQKDFDSILQYVGQISQVADSKNRGMSRPGLANVLREDELRSGDDLLAGKREVILAEAPKREGDHFVVRKIIEKEG